MHENDIKQHFNNLSEWRVFIQYYSFILSFNTFFFLSNQTKPAAIKTTGPLSKLPQQIIFKFCIPFSWSTYNKTLWRALQKWLQFCQVIVSLGERNQTWRITIKQYNSHIIPKFILQTNNISAYSTSTACSLLKYPPINTHRTNLGFKTRCVN